MKRVKVQNKRRAAWRKDKAKENDERPHGGQIGQKE